MRVVMLNVGYSLWRIANAENSNPYIKATNRNRDMLKIGTSRGDREGRVARLEMFRGEVGGSLPYVMSKDRAALGQ